jgi:nicotinamidase/pyrazinamidase
MIKGRLVFIDVDTQRDFFANGALPVPRADEIRPVLARLLAWARAHDVPVIATACAHTSDARDPGTWPEHCLLGTPGQERVEESHTSHSRVLAVDARLPPGEALPRHITVHKTRYDVFSRSDFEEILARYNRDAPTFVVFGVATDYCVGAVIDGLLERRCRVAIVVDAVRAIDPEREQKLLTAWARRGVLLTVSDRICDAQRTWQDMPG